MSRWDDRFTPGGYVGGDFFHGDVAPEDLLLGRVHDELAADADLAAIFTSVDSSPGTGDLIECMETRNPFDFREFPRLQIYALSTDEAQSPTLIDDNLTSIYTAIRFDALQILPVQPYHATIASVRRLIAKRLKALKSLPVTVAGAEIPLAVSMRPGQGVWQWDATASGDRIAAHWEQRWDYQIYVDHETQHIHNLAIVGAVP